MMAMSKVILVLRNPKWSAIPVVISPSCSRDLQDLHMGMLDVLMNRDNLKGRKHTLLETNIAPENGWFEDEFPFGKAYFQELC